MDFEYYLFKYNRNAHNEEQVPNKDRHEVLQTKKFPLPLLLQIVDITFWEMARSSVCAVFLADIQ